METEAQRIEETCSVSKEMEEVGFNAGFLTQFCALSVEFTGRDGSR